MTLALARQENFNGVPCDFYRQQDAGQPEIWMTREQIGQALGYSQPRSSISKIHDRNKERLDQFSTVTNLATVENGRTVTRDIRLYSPRGVYEICRWSRQPKADAFMDFCWDVIERLRVGQAGHEPNGLPLGFSQMMCDTLALMGEAIKANMALAESVRSVLPAMGARTPSAVEITTINTEIPASVCKLETFPPRIRGQVEEMLDEMLETESLNYSKLARLCVANGYMISIPAVRRYCLRRLGRDL